MKSGIDNFIELLVKGDFFLIFLIVMMLVVICIIAYLIKMQMSDRYNYEEDDEDEDDNFVEKYIPLEETPTSKKIDQTKFDFENNSIESSIKNYESDQEEMAIISTDELETRINSMKETGEFDKHLEKIDEYEKEQENKAIISYEELLKRASMNTITYESTENLGGVKVGKVDTSKIETLSEESNNPYYKEEAFLSALKEFRGSL